MTSLDQIDAQLEHYSPTIITPTASSRRASVALIIDGESDTPHILIIRRAANPADPWSGHLAFPGGRYDAGDNDVLTTAIRETREEVGIDLTMSTAVRTLGRLDDVQGRARGQHIDLIISCFVFAVQQRPSVTLETKEVDAHYWISVHQLLAPSRQVAFASPHHSTTPYPGIQITDEPQPVLWGLTYRFTRELLTVAQANLPLEVV